MPGIARVHLPGREERGPVDALDEVVERVVGERPDAEEGRDRRRDVGPVDGEPVAARLGDRVPGDPLLARAALHAERLVLARGSPAAKPSRAALVHERAGDPDRARCVRDVDDRAVVLGLDADGGVGPRRRRAADQQRDREALALHLGRDVAHLLERRA